MSDTQTNNSANLANSANSANSVKTVNRALLIGINYVGSSCPLNGCINDSENIRDFLIKNKYFTPNDFIMMNENQTGELVPTRENMIAQMKNLVTFANSHPDDKVELFIAYSGHGATLSDDNGDESNGKDEVLCPVDCFTKGYIRDDWLKSEFVDKFGPNVRIVMMIDACHSGTIVDLKYNYACDTTNSCNILSKVTDTKCECIMISGCRDEQTSADAFLPDSITKKMEYQGAMSASFINNYVDGINYLNLITKMRTWLRNSRYTQIPQLSSGRQLDVANNVLLSTYDE